MGIEILVRERVGICPVCLARICEVTSEGGVASIERFIAQKPECAECVFLWFDDEDTIQDFHDEFSTERTS